MTELRDRLEATGSPLVALDEQTGDILRAVVELYDQGKVRTMALDAMLAVAYADDDDRTEALRQADELLGLLDGRSEAEVKVRDALARRDSHSPSALDDFAKKLARHELGNPSGDLRRYSTDRSPRRVRKVIDGHKATTPVIIAADGTVIGEDNP